MKTSGFFIVSAVIFAALVACVSLVLSHNLILALSTHKNRCSYYQTQFLAQSGLVYAESNWNSIPELSVLPNKETLYASVYPVGLKVTALQSRVSLIKTSSIIYSIALGDNQSRMILYAPFTSVDGKVKLGPIQKL